MLDERTGRPLTPPSGDNGNGNGNGDGNGNGTPANHSGRPSSRQAPGGGGGGGGDGIGTAPQQGQPSPSTPSTKRKEAVVAQPSASILLISPDNEVLLLHRVRTATSYPAAHVFPGGNLAPQDATGQGRGGEDSYDPSTARPTDARRHLEAPAYRRAAIRELFEESGILLARERRSGRLVRVSQLEREEGRHAVREPTVARLIEEIN
ncbi:hypothetical protein KEM52_003271, partial [Ascosphaera acerosa]